MFFSGKLIKKLIIEMASHRELKDESVQNLIYHLKLPGTAIPRYIASVIAGYPELTFKNSLLPSRLAYGILDDAFIFYDQSQRYKHQKKLCKKVESIEIGLKKLEQPAKVIEVFDQDYSKLVFAAEATNDLGAKQERLSKPELATLVERLIEAFTLETELTCKILTRVVNHFERDEKNRLETRVSETIKEGIKNAPWNDSSHHVILFDLDEPVRFKQSLTESDRFSQLVWKTLDNISMLCKI